MGPQCYCGPMSLWLLVALIVISTHRVTRLITRDALPLIAAPREAFVQRWGGYVDAETPEERKLSINGSRTNIVMKSLAYLWECDWCASVWVAAGVTYTAWEFTILGEQHWAVAILVGLAASSGTGLIAQREPE